MEHATTAGLVIILLVLIASLIYTIKNLCIGFV